MTTTYTFSRDAGPDEWRALPHKFLMGEQVQKFNGHDYGLARDDFMYLGVATISCTENGEQSFTVPCDFLLTEAGHPPSGPYMRVRS